METNMSYAPVIAAAVAAFLPAAALSAEDHTTHPFSSAGLERAQSASDSGQFVGFDGQWQQ